MAKIAEETAKEHSPQQQLKLPFKLDPNEAKARRISRNKIP
ncbi:MAG: hypothetical protein U5L00_18360 [Desulfovermiculus sp.]|nr:hypothetical protein [Desulfovermiculus sp.]